MNNTNKSASVGKRNFRLPVSWLMGRELLAGLKYIAAYSFMGDKFDARDWMQGQVENAPKSDAVKTEDTYWFDFIADTGDGMLAVYNIAYLCQSDLWLDEKTPPGEALRLHDHLNSACTRLPRGEFLFVGGDTAYHIADTASLKERFQTPFNWAFEDLTQAGQRIERRPIYAIPANHDYYDALDGFNRQFRSPFSRIGEQLALEGFERKQEASYVSLKLPYGWTLWGFDSQEGKMDKRQMDFFKNDNKGEVPDKLIVVTPEPTTVFGKWQSEGAKIVETFNALGLQPSFLQNHNGSLEHTRCRLDLSGDIHHYERYWGADKTNYASVVAGGGGAFLHPSHTDLGEVEQKALYPSRLDSYRLSTRHLLNPWTIACGGFVWLTGAVIALLSYFAVTVPESTWSFIGRHLFSARHRPLNSAQPGELGKILERIETALKTDSVTPLNPSAYFSDLIFIIAYLGILGLGIYGLTVYLRLLDNPEQEKSGIMTGMISQLMEKNWHIQRLYLVAPTVALALPLFIWITQQRKAVPDAFTASLLIELFSLAAILLFVLSRKYSDLLNRRAHDNPFSKFDLYPLWIFSGILTPLFAGYGFLHYGIYPASVMTFNLLIMLIWTLCLVGLPLLAFIVGGMLLRSKSEAFRYGLKYQNKSLFFGIGAWHALLQVATPVSLVLYDSWLTIVSISFLAAAATEIARRYFASSRAAHDPALPNQFIIGKHLFIAWGLLGASVLLAAVLGGKTMPVTPERLLAAFGLGALFGCLWFGWYLDVSLAFNGHNNEAGGGARSQNYRHMIRFVLKQDSLTGYVIGIDAPYPDSRFVQDNPDNKPKFRLVDKFTIVCPTAAKTPEVSS